MTYSFSRELLALPKPGPLVGNEALFIDFDGTLVEIASTPQSIKVAPNLCSLLKEVGDALSGAFAIVSGRTIDDIDRLTRGNVVAIAGVHGLDRRSSRHANGNTSDIQIKELVAAAPLLSELQMRWPGISFEMKGLALALHYRLQPDAKSECYALLESIAKESKQNLELLEGKCVLELKLRGKNKGSAVRAFMDEEPFKGRRPIFVGDDETDESAFRAVSSLGGINITVGPRWPTSATYALRSVRDVHSWLQARLDLWLR